mmetsp:Transcript_24662/g.36332  ORF Transcript_24662/g.36332 Transcript_24662/m.36332 type:complete len:425 (-) Transcript_24662:182-1456(-)
MSSSPKPDSDLSLKQAAKEQRNYLYRKYARNWVEEVTGETLVGEFGIALKDGQVLCKLINAIKPNSVRKIETATMAFKEMENISNFLKACREVGMVEHELFETVDLYEAKDIGRVISCLHALSRTIKTTVPEYSGPYMATVDLGDHFVPPPPPQSSNSPSPPRMYFRSLSKSPSPSPRSGKRTPSRSPSRSPVNGRNTPTSTGPGVSARTSTLVNKRASSISPVPGGKGRALSPVPHLTSLRIGESNTVNNLVASESNDTTVKPIAQNSSNPPSQTQPLGARAPPRARGLEKEDQALLTEEATEWIQAITGEAFHPHPFAERLKSGELLCKLINNIKPESVKRINKQPAPFMQMENISAFLKACRAVGVPEHDLFETVDLYEERDIAAVVRCLYALGRTIQVTVPEFKGPVLGPKLAVPHNGLW